MRLIAEMQEGEGNWAPLATLTEPGKDEVSVQVDKRKVILQFQLEDSGGSLKVIEAVAGQLKGQIQRTLQPNQPLVHQVPGGTGIPPSIFRFTLEGTPDTKQPKKVSLTAQDILEAAVHYFGNDTFSLDSLITLFFATTQKGRPTPPNREEKRAKAPIVKGVLEQMCKSGDAEKVKRNAKEYYRIKPRIN